MAFLTQGRGQGADRFRGPPQRRLRIAPGHRVDQRLERRDQAIVIGFRAPASATGPPGPPLARSGPVLGFLAAPTHGVGGDSGRLRHDEDPARPQFRGLRAQPQPPLKLRQCGRSTPTAVPPTRLDPP